MGMILQKEREYFIPFLVCATHNEVELQKSNQLSSW